MTKCETEGERALDGRVRELERAALKYDLVWATVYAVEFGRLRTDAPGWPDAVVANTAARRANRAVTALRERNNPEPKDPT